MYDLWAALNSRIYICTQNSPLPFRLVAHMLSCFDTLIYSLPCPLEIYTLLLSWKLVKRRLTAID